MKESIAGGIPSGNNQSSVPEKQSNAEWVDSYRRSEWVNDDLDSRTDFLTGELKPLLIDQEFTKKHKRNRLRWERDQAIQHRYFATDPGVLLKRLYLADESEKRVKGFDDVLGVHRLIAKRPEPIEGCSGLEHLNDWSDTRMVSEITVGAQDVMITSTLRGGREQVGGGARGKITDWSKQSRGRCEKHIRNVPEGAIKAFLTLTYPNDYTNDGKRIKRDLSAMIKRLKRMGVKDGIWFLEFQKRGAPHFHCFLSQWPRGGSDSVAKAWYEVVGSGDEKHLQWHTGDLSGRPCLEYMRVPHAASYYASKYAVKAEQKVVPDVYQNVGRFWGYWGDLKPIYQTYYSRGSESCARAVRMIAAWKFERFGGVVGADLVLYTATLRGCSPMELDGLFESSGWVPD